jgi:hypothetical protein
MANMGLYLGLGVLGIAGGYLFFTKDGKEMINGFMDSIGALGSGGGMDFEGISKSAIEAGYDDPFKYMKGSNANAWDPTSDLYKRIQKRAERSAKNRKRMQQHYIESYLSSAFI